MNDKFWPLIKKWQAFCLGLGVSLLWMASAGAVVQDAPTPWPVKNVLQLELNGTVNPSVVRYLEQSLQQFPQSDLLILKINTPGGLITTTRSILTFFGNLERPWVAWITPSGASATSAGAIVAAGAQVIVASEGTNIGAATPIEAQGDNIKSDLRSKAINDLMALVRSMATMHGRNAQAFEEMINHASSFSAPEAAAKKVIDHLINTESELWPYLNQKTVHLAGKSLRLIVEQPPTVHVPQVSLGMKFFQVIAHPELAYLLFLLAIGLFYLEVHTGGTFVAAGFGIICLILAAMAFQVVPINFGGAGLIILGAVLLGLEIFITSYGLLGISGAAALAIGSMLIFETPDSFLAIPYTLIAICAIVIVLVLGIIIYVIIRDIRHGRDFFSFKGSGAVIVAALPNSALWQVRIRGEIWQAQIESGTPQVGEVWDVVAEDRAAMLLTIRPKRKNKTDQGSGGQGNP